MRWENLTCDDFAEAVRSTGGVCVVAAGVLERHAAEVRHLHRLLDPSTDKTKA